MDEKMRELIAIFRHSVIGSLISGELCHGDLTKQIVELSKRRYQIPFSTRTSIGIGTIEDWLYAYRYNGIEGLKPKSRSDQGKIRGVDDETIKIISEYKAEHPRMPLRLVIKRLNEEKKLPDSQIPLTTLYR